jgi:hypothetical protein
MAITSHVRVAAFVSLCALSSVLAFGVVFVPLLPLLAFSGKVFRRAVDVAFHNWHAFVAVSSSMRVTFSGRSLSFSRNRP